MRLAHVSLWLRPEVVPKEERGLAALIHSSAWKIDSPKSVCSILYILYRTARIRADDGQCPYTDKGGRTHI
jgi:hypothetical protein